MEYVLSLATNKKHVVYHTEACPYAKRIKYKNKMMISSRQISSAGYEPCACCNNDSRYLKLWVKFFKGKGYSDLEIKQVGNYVVYVRTNVGFWKIFLAALGNLLSNEWKGNHILFLGDECKATEEINIDKIGFYNPRKGEAYTLKVDNINKNLVRKIEREVFKYNNSIYDQN